MTETMPGAAVRGGTMAVCMDRAVNRRGSRVIPVDARLGTSDIAAMHNDGEAPPTAILMEAIARHMAVSVVYNRQQMTLAPHIAYTRHGDLFIDAVAIEREGKPPRELKLGTFKFAGLNDIALTRRHFEPSVLFDATAERYAGTTLFVISREPAPVV